MFEALLPHPEDRLQLRRHRARSVILTPEELVEIRAAQRTFEGAYMRTALGQFSFALVVLKIFTSEFYAIGALYAVYGAAVMLVAIYRRYEGNRQFFNSEEEVKHPAWLAPGLEPGLEPGPESAVGPGSGRDFGPTENTLSGLSLRRRSTVTTKKFRTSGNSVALLSLLSLSAYISLVVLMWRLDDD